MKAKHAWITRYLFPEKGDSVQNQYIIEVNPDDHEETAMIFVHMIDDFGKELGGLSNSPQEVAHGRYVFEGPKGFSVVELAPAFTQEEYDQIVGTDKFDLTVFEKLFQGEISKEDERERQKEGEGKGQQA